MPPVKRLFKVDVEVEFEPTTETVYVWAEDESEAERMAEEEVDDLSVEPASVERVRIEGCDEATLQDFEHELRYHPSRYLPGGPPGASMKSLEPEIRESLAEESKALEAWAAQGVLPGLPPPPLPSRCEECGARPPLTAHEEGCALRTLPDPAACEDAVGEGSQP